MRQCSWKHCLKEVNIDGRNRNSENTFCEPKCKNKFYVDKRRNALKAQAVEYMGGKCVRCGFDEHQSALTFHHLDPSKKDFGIANSGTMAWDKLTKELDKCIMVCANCHNVIHHLNLKEFFLEV